MAIPYEQAVDPRATKITTARLKAFGMSFPMLSRESKHSRLNGKIEVIKMEDQTISREEAARVSSPARGKPLYIWHLKVGSSHVFERTGICSSGSIECFGMQKRST